MQNLEKHLRKLLSSHFIKYAIVGASSTIIDTVVLAIMVEIFKLDPTVGKLFSQIVSITNGYYWNRRWTFGDRENKVKYQYFRFVAVSLAGLLIALIVFNFFNDVMGIWYIAANLLTAIVVLVWNFNINRIFTFK